MDTLHRIIEEVIHDCEPAQILFAKGLIRGAIMHDGDCLYQLAVATICHLF